jgi:uncharacterized protein
MVTEARTIDLKGLDHGQRESQIFPNLEKLQMGESLRLVVEFNPIPLVLMLNAQEQFAVGYDKEGPDEWIVRIQRTAPSEDSKGHFKRLLRELKEGKISEEAKDKAKQLFQSVDAATLGVIEQELIREGVSHEEIRQSLCDIHLDVMREALVDKRVEVSAPHPVHTLMEEHVVILKTLGDLRSLLDRLQTKNSIDDLGADLANLQDIAHHLVEAESHHQREEDVLFPRLEAHDVVEPPSIMKMDHVEFRKRKKELYQTAHNPTDYGFVTFKNKVNELGGYLVKELDSHIFKEDNILYQIALQVLTPQDWEEVKVECDKIGYCCFTPGDQSKSAEVIEVDLRSLPPFQRHDLIFKTWDSLKPGQTLKLINDHDPKPLRYQFEAEYKDQHTWDYELTGPVDWAVKIKKL